MKASNGSSSSSPSYLTGLFLDPALNMSTVGSSVVEIWVSGWVGGMTRRDTERQEESGGDKVREYETRRDKKGQGEARSDKTRQGKAGQDKMRQDGTF